jgi:hypothetical protein
MFGHLAYVAIVALVLNVVIRGADRGVASRESSRAR